MLKRILFTVRRSLFTQFAFTLAETLIVMGIIGVVAALTLPNLNNSTGEKEKVTKLQKIYSNLQDALGRAEAVYGPFPEWCSSNLSSSDCADKSFERIIEFMKYSIKCTISDNCNYSFGINNISSTGVPAKRVVMLADGTAIDFFHYDHRDSILVDIDGINKGANQSGKDVFKFLIAPNTYNQGIYIKPISWQLDYQGAFRNLSDYFPIEFTNWIINFGNMDYLKLDSSGKCPDGKTILDGVSNITCK